MTDLSEFGGDQHSPEAELRRRLGDHDFLVDLFQLGEQMQAFIETTPGNFLFRTLKDDVNRNLKDLLAEPSLGTDRANAAWARAKTAWAALVLIEETLAMGSTAESMISETGVVTP